jgi:D-threo-aldose 1-dehydrogenase
LIRQKLSDPPESRCKSNAGIKATQGFARGGLKVTALGLGYAAIGGLYRDAPIGDANAALQTAWDRGIRYFDMAPIYGLGRALHILGNFLREAADPAN